MKVGKINMGNGIEPKYTRKAWTILENELLKNWYPQIGKAVCHLLPGRTETACEVRATQVFHLKYKYDSEKCKPLTAKEQEILKDCCDRNLSLIEVASKLPGRSYDDIKANIHSLNRNTKNPLVKWTEEEIDYLIKNYKKLSTLDIAIRVNKSLEAVRTKANFLGLSSTHTPWSEEEDNIIRENYGNMEIYDVRQLLLNAGFDRTEYAIVTRASIIGASTRARFTKWEDEVIYTESKRGTTPEEISEKFLPVKTPAKIAARYKYLLKKGIDNYD